MRSHPLVTDYPAKNPVETLDSKVAFTAVGKKPITGSSRPPSDPFL